MTFGNLKRCQQVKSGDSKGEFDELGFLWLMGLKPVSKCNSKILNRCILGSLSHLDIRSLFLKLNDGYVDVQNLVVVGRFTTTPLYKPHPFKFLIVSTSL